MSKVKNVNIDNRFLHPNTINMINESDERRIQYIKEGIFINYDAGKEITQEILDLLDQPIRPRMEGLLLISPTNNGKTTLIKKFIKDFSEKIGRFGYIETPERTTLKEFYIEILNVLGYPTKSTKATGDYRRKIIVAIKRHHLKLLFIDEIHNLLDSRRDHKRDVLNGLKSLNNKAQIPIVLIGINKAKEILDEDEQVADRYPPILLPEWINDKEFRDLLATFEAYLPLKKSSNLYNNKISSIILNLSKGRIGRISAILRKTSIKAIRTKKERITLDLLKSIPFRWERIDDFD